MSEPNTESPLTLDYSTSPFAACFDGGREKEMWQWQQKMTTSFTVLGKRHCYWTIKISSIIPIFCFSKCLVFCVRTCKEPAPPSPFSHFLIFSQWLCNEWIFSKEQWVHQPLTPTRSPSALLPFAACFDAGREHRDVGLTTNSYIIFRVQYWLTNNVIGLKNRRLNPPSFPPPHSFFYLFTMTRHATHLLKTIPS